MGTYLISDPALAVAITRISSKQSYFTIRFLVDKPLVDHAYRAYAYFRWLDDALDHEMCPRGERLAFVRRQQALMNGDYCSLSPVNLRPEERLLVDLIRHDPEPGNGLQAYIHNMMAVMAFDADRRGRLISQAELDEYTHLLAAAVTEALHYFIGHNCASPHNESRYLAATGAHITHMLRDAIEDAGAGYYNIPREVVSATGIAPWDVHNAACRHWVKERVREARACFRAGRDYLAQVESLRCRIAGYAYIHRFEVVLDCIEREDFVLRTQYPERTGRGHGVEMIGWALWMAIRCHRPVPASSF